LDRTHLLKDDLDWLPPSLKAVRWVVAGTLWTGMAGAAFGVMLATHSGGALAGLFKSLAVVGFYAGDRAARGVLRRRLGKLAHGEVELSRLKQEADGELVHVRGRVRARGALTGLLDERASTVYRRVRLTLGEVHLVHEAAVDFSLVDERGEVVFVQVSGARLVAPEPKKQKLVAVGPQVERLLAQPWPKQADRWIEKRAKRQSKGKSMPTLFASEFLLQENDEIEVVGYKTRVVDVSLEARLERETPLRATLRDGRELPVIISPAMGRRA
jgi:hypothetical protein